MQNVNTNVKYEIQRDVNGVWVVQGTLGEQKFATVYAKDTAALVEIFLMLDGSGFCPPADDNDEGPLNMRLVCA